MKLQVTTLTELPKKVMASKEIIKDKVLDVLAAITVFTIIMALLFGFESMGLMAVEVLKNIF